MSKRTEEGATEIDPSQDIQREACLDGERTRELSDLNDRPERYLPCKPNSLPNRDCSICIVGSL